MQNIAIELNESDSEYIRKAVEQRNAQHKQPVQSQALEDIKGFYDSYLADKSEASTNKNNTDNQVKPRTVSEYLKDVEAHKNNTVSKPIEKYWDETNNRPMNPVDNKKNYAESVKAKQEFKSFPKGGGKK